MSSVDQRIVEMQFENKQFEKGIKESVTSLDNLKKSLKLEDSVKGLENLDKAAKSVSLSTISDGIDQISSKFTALGIIGVTALQNITNSAINTGKQLVSSLTTDQISSGWDKYNLKVEGVQTIMAATGKTIDEVSGSLEKLNWFTDETSYNFTDMVSNIGKFTSSGVDLDTAVTSMEGIANWAAVSGVNATKASSAMYNVSQAIAAGAMKLQDWKSIQMLNMNTQEFQQTAIDTAVSMGTLTKSGDDLYTTLEGNSFSLSQFANELSDGWFSSDVLVATLSKYGEYADAIYEISDSYDTCSEAMANFDGEGMELGEKAFKAAQEAKTFGDAIDSVKDAVSTGWMTTFELIFGNYEEAKVLWTDLANELYDVFATSGNNRNEILSEAMNSNWDKLVSKINDAGISSETFQKKLEDTLTESGKDVDQLVEKYGSLEEAFTSGALSTDYLQKAVDGLSKSVVDLSDITDLLRWGSTGDDVKKIQEALDNLGYDLGSYGIDGIIGNYTQAAIKSFQEANDLIVDGIVGPQTIAALQSASESTEELNLDVQDLISSITDLGGRDLLIESLWNAFHGLVKVIDTVKEASSEIFPPMTAERLYNIIEGIHEFSEGLIMSDETADKLKRTLKGGFAVLDIGIQAISAIVGGIKDIIEAVSPAGNGFLSFTANIGDWLVGLDESVRESQIFVKAIQSITSKLKSGATTVKTNVIGEERYAKATEYIVQILNKLGVAYDEAKVKAKEFMASLSENEYVQKLISYLTDLKDEAIDNIIDGLEKLATLSPAELLNDFLSFLDKGKTKVEGFVDTIKEKGLSGALDMLASGLEKLKEFGGGVLTDVGDGLGLLGEAIGKFLDGIHPGSIFVLANAISVLLAVLAARKVMSSASKLMDTLRSAISGFSGSNETSKIEQLANAIGTLALALIFLSLMDQEKLKSSAIILASMVAVIGVLVGTLGVLSKLEKISDLESISKGILEVSVSIGVLALALKLISTMTFGDIAVSLTTLALVIAGLGTVAVLMTKYGVQLEKGALFLVGFAAAVYILVGALKKIDNIDPSLNSVMKLEAIMVGLGVAAKLASGIKFTSGMGVLALVVAIRVLVGSLKAIAKLDPNLIADNIGSFVEVFGTLVILLMGLKAAGENSLKGGLGILAISVALEVITDVIERLGKLSGKVAGQGTVVVSVLMLVFGIIEVLSKFVGANAVKAGIGCVAMAGAILLLSQSVESLGNLDPDTVHQGVLAIAELGAILSGMMVLSKWSSGGGKTAIALTVAVAALAACLYMLTMIPDQSALTNVSKSLAIVIGAFALLTAASGLAGKSVGTILIMTVALAGVSVMLGVLSGLPNADSILPIAEGLSLVLTAIAAAALICSNIDTGNITTALSSIGYLDLFIANVTAVITALGALNDYIGGDTLSSWMNGGAEILGTVGTAIGNFIGGIIGGFGDKSGIGSMLSGVGQSLSDFATDAAEFFTTASTIDPTAATGVESMAKAILAITKTDVLKGLTDWFTGGNAIDEFSAGIAALGKGLKNYADSVSGLDTSGIDASVDVAEKLTAVAKKLPNEGGLISKLIGDNSIGQFGSELKQLGTGLKDYGDSVSGIDTSGLDASVDVAEKLTSVAEAVPNEGGLISKLVGENSIAKFGSELKQLGTGLKDYADSVSGMKTDGLQSAIDAATDLAELAEILPNTGGVISWFTGDNDLADFGDGLQQFGDAFNQYYASVSGIDVGKLSNITTQLGRMVTVIESMSSVGYNSTNGITDALYKLAQTKFSDFVDGFESGISDAEVSGEKFGEALATGIKTSLADFDDTIQTVGKSLIIAFFTSMTGEIQNDQLELITAFTAAFALALQAGLTAIDESRSRYKYAGSSLAEAMISAIRSRYSGFYSAGAYVVQGFAQGISSNRSTAITAASNVATAALKAANSALGINSPSKEFAKAGMYSDLGLAKGLIDYSGNVEDASVYVADMTLLAMQNAISRVNQVLESDMDTSPVIRPVIDVTDLSSGITQVNGMFAANPIWSYGGINEIASAMRNKEIRAENDDVVSAIDSLRRDIANLQTNSYHIGNITYDDGTNVADAIESLIRAARIERRV